MTPHEQEPLSRRCTLEVGGAARFFVEAVDERTVLDADAWARARDLPVRVLGGGSNLVVADDGVDGLVLRIAVRGIEPVRRGGAVDLTVGAGEVWDDVVRLAVERGWAGIECLSGIPGLAGATPIQNVGAYGQEVSDTIVAVRALDRAHGRVVTLAPAECAFGYRTSRLKTEAAGRYVVLAVTYRLGVDRPPVVRYPELARHLEQRGTGEPSLADVRASVLAVRRTKSMVLDSDDPNRRSCGSFFLNPIVPREAADEVTRRAGDAAMPRWTQPDGQTNLSAAWLIERAGFARGERHGPVGLSTRHALAIVCHAGAHARDVVAFAERIQTRVRAVYGVHLGPEPVLWGFGPGVLAEKAGEASPAAPP
jgi:UDP-N-acetylmuramate dehydrogenase